MSRTRFLLAFLVVSLLIAGVGSFYASSHPDGLNFVAEKTGFIDREQASPTAEGPFAATRPRASTTTASAAASPGSRAPGSRCCSPEACSGCSDAATSPRGRPTTSAAPPARGPDPVGAGHGHRLHVHGHSVVHRAPAHVKLLVLLGFVLVVVATPRQWFPVFGVHLVVLLAVVALSRVPPLFLAKRMLVETPFVLFAVLVPFIAEGERVEVLGLSLSGPGLLAAWGLLVKGSLGVLASLTLAATTEPQDVLVGLRRLRMPDQIVQIMGFMLRYLDVVTAELGRMTVAMRSRGLDPRSPRHWPLLGRTLGALFIRSYERGERVHLAMLARGYDGRMPDLDDHRREAHA